MLFRQIEYFQAIIETGNFYQAAEKCNVSQSAISQQIKKLEQELGVKLLDRHNRTFSLTPDGKIGGLPGKAADLINKTKDNAKIERIKNALINIIGHNRISGDLGIPDFTSEFQFSNGACSVADSGFTVDMAALDRRLTPQPHDNMYSDMYEYSFRKVL